MWDNGVIRIQLTARTKPKLVHVDRVEPWITKDATRPEWVEEAVKRFAPERQEIGLQVELDYEGGEIVRARPAPGSLSLSSLSLTPVKPCPSNFSTCRVCGELEINNLGIRRTFTGRGICQICVSLIEGKQNERGTSRLKKRGDVIDIPITDYYFGSDA